MVREEMGRWEMGGWGSGEMERGERVDGERRDGEMERGEMKRWRQERWRDREMERWREEGCVSRSRTLVCAYVFTCVNTLCFQACNQDLIWEDMSCEESIRELVAGSSGSGWGSGVFPVPDRQVNRQTG